MLERDQSGYYRGEWKGRTIRLPSVTTVLGILGTYDKVNPALLERNAAFGTAVHRLVDLYERNRLDVSSLKPEERGLADLTPILDAWLKCRTDHTFGPRVFTEEAVVSLRHGYAGTVDVVAFADGIWTLIEVKSRPFNPANERLQTAAYWTAWNEDTERVRIERRAFCELRLDGTYDWRTMKGKDDFLYFKSCLAAFNWRESGGTL